MQIGPLSFLTRTNSPWTFGLAAWHSPHSLTWRWLLHWNWFRGDERRATWRILWWSPNNVGVQAMLMIPWVGRFWFSTQKPMWYRDLYTRARDEQDGFHKRVEIANPPAEIRYIAPSTDRLQ